MNSGAVAVNDTTHQNDYVFKTINCQKPVPVKKLVIDNYSPAPSKENKYPSLSSEEVLGMIHSIEVNLEKIIIADNCCSSFYNETVVMIEHLCYLGHNAELNSHIPYFIKWIPKKMDFVLQFLNTDVKLAVFEELIEDPDRLETLLLHLRAVYDSYCVAVRRMVSVLFGLERSNVIRRCPQAMFWNQSIQSFEKIVFHKNIVLKAVTHYITTTLFDYRKMILSSLPIEETIERLENTDLKNTLIYKLCQMTIEIGIFVDFIEDSILDKAADDYKSITIELRQKFPINDYVLAVKKILDYEVTLSKKLFRNHSCSLLLFVVKQTMVINLLDDILENEFDELLDKMVCPHIEQLRFIYETIVDCKHPLADLSQAFSSEIRVIGHARASDPNQQKHLITNILNLKQATDSLIKKCFNSNEAMLKNVKAAFTHFSNQQSTHIVTHLVQHLDGLMTVRNRYAVKEDASSLEKKFLIQVCKTLSLMKYIHSKDHFQCTYQKYLARRLLTGTYISISFEKRILKYIKTGFGAEVTHKMEGMIRDVEKPHETIFTTNSDRETIFLQLGCKYRLLTKNFWPRKFSMALVLPNQLEAFRQNYENTFHELNTHQDLKWNPIYSDVILTYRSRERNSVDIKLCLLQACIVLLFNRYDSLTVSEVKKRINIARDYYFNIALSHLLNFNDGCSLLKITNSNDQQLAKTTVQLSFPSNAVVTLSVNLPLNTLIVDLSEEFYMSLDISSGHPTEGGSTINQDNLNANPQSKIYQIDSSIMRIMKSVSKMEHKSLFENTNAKLDFELTEQLFQARVNVLLDRDYIKEDDTIEDPAAASSIKYKYVP